MIIFIQKQFFTKHLPLFLLVYFGGITPFCLAEMVYQDFENGESDLCWTWDQDATVSGEIVHSGNYSCKLQGVNGNNGIGVKSKQGWHTDFDNSDYLAFWIYALPDREIEKENTVLVKFFDHNTYHDKGYEIWTPQKTRYGEWIKLAIPFSQLPNNFNRHDVDKIEFLNYWPGIYYFDDIQIETIPHWDYSLLREGVLQWQPVTGVEQYRLEESTSANPNDWHMIYEGTATRFTIPRFTSANYRVRVELPYVSDWSQTLISPPLGVLIRHAQLQQGNLEWSPLPQAESYEVQSATNLHGPWNRVYKGLYPPNPLSVSADTWYRVRALRVGETETTSWSPPQWQPSTIEKGLLRTQGTTIRDSYGDEVILQGVNLGGFLLNETWLTGLGAGDQPTIEDDWSLREVLQDRFEAAAPLLKFKAAAPLLKIYQDAFFKADDCDILMRMGLNVIRLPIFYRNLQDADGNWITDNQGKIDFEKIDQVVNSCANNGIYTLLDLHGAPGSQSNIDHTGRANFNKLFEDSPAGEAFRDQTVRIWKEIAIHYQNHLAIAGYDLLNEPTGAPNPETLWHLYDRLYQAIRSQDPYHLIVMEGIWDWDTLPIPAKQGWENVVYQFHFYNWNHNNDLQAHKDFVDDKIVQGILKQAQYQVPVMIGEFNGFALSETWEYYLEKFNKQRWSWIIWNYKAHDPNSNWGLYTHTGYDELLPKFRAVQADGSMGDSFDDLARKLTKYDTLGHFSPNHALIEVVQRFTGVPEPDIKVNGMDGTLEITQSDNNLLITVAVNAKGYSGKPTDWWLVESSDTAPFNWYYFDYIGSSLSWLSGISVAHQSPLFSLYSYEVPKPNLSLGTHTFYFGIDLNQNGEVDEPLYYDAVVVNIVYAVHDDGLNDSQFLAISPTDLTVELLGTVYTDYDIEGLDISPENNEIYASSGDNTDNPAYLYKVLPCALTTIGPIKTNDHPLREVDALSFRPTDGSLWGWAQSKGLIVIDPNLAQATLMLAHQGEIEDLTWDTEGKILYAVENMHTVGTAPDAEPDSKLKSIILWAFDGNTAVIACEKAVENNLEIEAVEALADGNLLFGFHDSNELLTGIVDPNTCAVNYINEMALAYNDIEGIGLATPRPAFINFTGEVVSDADGIYRIISDEGQRYLPTNLPTAFKQSGLRIDIKAKIIDFDEFKIAVLHANHHGSIDDISTGCLGPSLFRLGGTTAFVPMKHDFAETDSGEPHDPNALTHVLATTSGNEDIDFAVGMCCTGGKTVELLRVDHSPPIGTPLDGSGELVNFDSGMSEYSQVVTLKPFPKDWLEYECANVLGDLFQFDAHPIINEIEHVEIQTDIEVTGKCTGATTVERIFPISLDVSCKDLDYNP